VIPEPCCECGLEAFALLDMVPGQPARPYCALCGTVAIAQAVSVLATASMLKKHKAEALPDFPAMHEKEHVLRKFLPRPCHGCGSSGYQQGPPCSDNIKAARGDRCSYPCPKCNPRPAP
jgi:hypothetical protein